LIEFRFDVKKRENGGLNELSKYMKIGMRDTDLFG